MQMPDERSTNLYPNLEPLQPSAPLTSFVEPRAALTRSFVTSGSASSTAS